MSPSVSDVRKSGGDGFLTAEQSLEFLDRASEILARSLDYEQTLKEVARLAVPELADWCAIDIVQADGSLRQITSGHPDPEQERLLLELRRRFRATTRGQAGVARVVRTAEPEFVPDVSAPSGGDIELDESERATYERLAPRSYIIVPLITRARTLGALTLLSTRQGRRYGERDLAFAQHLARRFALAIDNARLFEESLAAQRRATFLARAGDILASSLDYEQTIRNVADIAVPEIVDWCAIQLLEDDGSIRQVAGAHTDPAKRRLASEVNERFPTDPNSPTGPANVIRTGETEHVGNITDEMIDDAVPQPELRQIIKDLGLRASITAPLRARGRVFGAITFVSAESGRTFSDADVELVEEIARRAGVAVDNARLYTERVRIAHTLQVELLPAEVPEIPFLEVATRYRAAGELNEVGGDFYDVFEGSDGRWIVVVGDVAGKGADAAAVTALARYTLRAASLQTSDPIELLETLNTALIAQRGGGEFCTVCVAVVEPAASGASIHVALGGHPQPVILRADGATTLAGELGTLLGIVDDPQLVDSGVELQPGDTMLLYTDGVIEAGRPAALLGEVGLARDLARKRPGTAAETVQLAEDAAVTAQGGAPRDDIALVALRQLGDAVR